MSVISESLNVSDRPRVLPVGHSEAMRAVLAAVEDVACASTTVLLLGESGTGKEVVARTIHRLSPRAAGPYVAVNCAALPGELLESELFGHEKGAFTGASERRVGRIEQANGGTLLLDEISEMPLPLQAKLLRVLQEREVDRVGGGRPVAVDVRVIGTSNRDLIEMIARRQFRADLYYRLCVFPIVLPPLRDRREDIPFLAEHLAAEIAMRLGRAMPRLSARTVEALSAYPWPGNVRELGNILERALIRCREAVLELEHLDGSLRAAGVVKIAGNVSTAGDVVASASSKPAPVSNAAPVSGVAALPSQMPIALAELERLAIVEALRRVGGNRTHAARLLGISLRTLRNKLRAFRNEEAVSADGQLLPMAEGSASDCKSWSVEMARESQETESAA